MANFNVAAISNVLVDLMNGVIADITTQPTDLFDALYARKKPASGPTGPKWTVQNTKMNASTYSSGGDYPAPERVTYLRPEIPNVGKYVISVAFDAATLDAIRISGTSYAGNLLANAVANAWRAMRNKVNSDLLANDPDSGGDADGVIGIPAIISNSNTYAGIDRTLVAEWQSAIVAAGGAVTNAKMVELFKLLVHTRRGNFKVLVGSPDVAEDVTELAEFTVVDPNRMAAPDAGASGFMGLRKLNIFSPLGYFQQRALLEWPGWVAGRLDYFDPDMLGLEVYRDFEQQQSELQKIPGRDLWVMEWLLHAQTRYDDPYHFSGALTGITT